MVEGARLESECAPQGYPGFESRSLRMLTKKLSYLYEVTLEKKF